MKSLAQIGRLYEVCFWNTMKLALRNKYSHAAHAATLIFGKQHHGCEVGGPDSTYKTFQTDPVTEKQDIVSCILCCSFVHREFRRTMEPATQYLQWGKNNTVWFEVVPHPPCSTDLAPCDFWLFPTLKRSLRGRSFKTDGLAAGACKTIFESWDSAEFEKTFLVKWVERWCKRIA